MSDFEVSVVIPVYNCASYISKAIESVLIQSEVKEIILVEDKSPDNALQISEDYQRQFPDRIRLFKHKNNENRGVSHSRNLGMKNARFKYVAFLDGDDYYLPNRFKHTKVVFENNMDADGVYEAVGTTFYSEKAQEHWNQSGGGLLTTITQRIEPNFLFENMGPNGSMGSIQCDGLTLKKSIFESIGYFDTDLRMEEDTMYFLKLAAGCRLFPGNIESPVAMRGVHDCNRVTDEKMLYLSYINTFFLLYIH